MQLQKDKIMNGTVLFLFILVILDYIYLGKLAFHAILLDALGLFYIISILKQKADIARFVAVICFLTLVYFALYFFSNKLIPLELNSTTGAVLTFSLIFLFAIFAIAAIYLFKTLKKLLWPRILSSLSSAAVAKSQSHNHQDHI